MNTMKNIALVPALVVAGFLALGGIVSPVQAEEDKFVTAVEKSLAAYKKDDVKEAKYQLELALKLLNEKRSGKLTSFLPKAPKGWTFEDDDSASGAMAMMNMGTMITRRYTKDSDEIEFSLFVDSPMLQTYQMVLNNPMMMGKGMEAWEVSGEKAVIKDTGMNREISMIVGGKMLILIKTSSVELEMLKTMAKSIDMDGLKKAL